MKMLKRQMVPKNWPINRKGNTWVVRPKSNLNSGIPLLFVLRDMLKLAQNRKEVKKALNNKDILLNGKVVKDEGNSVTLFDVITVIPEKGNYKLTLNDKGKFMMEKINEKEADYKIAKIMNKKMLKGKETQINLQDGRNLFFKEKCKTNDSVRINLKDKKIDKCLSLKEKSEVLVFGGKHAGKKGKIEKINEKEKVAEINTSNKEKINVLIKHLIVIE